MVMAIVAIICVAAIGAVLLFYYSGDGDGGGETTAWKVGDYVEWGTFYYTTEASKPGDVVGYQRYTVTAIDDNYLTIQMTYLDPARIEIQTQTTHALKNCTGFGYPSSYVPSIPYPVTDLGMDTVETDWGQLSAHHYQYSYETTGQTNTVNLWTRAGFYVVQDTATTGTFSQFIIITGTNIPSVYS